jgi:6,7-dimethyl-8-ribityllumazine synthase
MSSTLPERPDPLETPRRFAIVASRYNGEFVDGLRDGALQELALLAPGSEVQMVHVPGSFEIPLAVQTVALQREVDAIFAFGLIWEGQTRHAEFIAGSVTDALLELSLKYKIPVLHEVLVVQNEEQARARCTVGAELNRGAEAARAAVRMIWMLDEVRAGD